MRRSLLGNSRIKVTKSAAFSAALTTAAVSAAVSLATPTTVQARQTVTQSHPQAASKTPFVYMGVGAALGGLLAVGYHFLAEGGDRTGKCGPWNCALPYLTISGGIAGLFTAREVEAQRRAERPRVGMSLVFSSTEYAVPSLPLSLGYRDSLLAVATDSGTHVISTTSRSAALRRRGAGLSDVRQVAISGGAPSVFIGTGTALWSTPPTTGLLNRVFDGSIDALATSPTSTVASSGATIFVIAGEGESARRDSIVAPDHVSSISYDSIGNVFWVTTDSLLLELSLTGSAPALTQKSTLDGQAQGTASSPLWVAVALGSNGLAIWPRQSLQAGGVTTPIIFKGEPRFAFGVAFVGDDLFVAGGVDGITKVELSPKARIVGSSRQAGYATTIASDGTALWVGDNSQGKSRVLRVVP